MTAVGRFRARLHADLTGRTEELADEGAALASLEEERATMPVSKKVQPIAAPGGQVHAETLKAFPGGVR